MQIGELTAVQYASCNGWVNCTAGREALSKPCTARCADRASPPPPLWVWVATPAPPPVGVGVGSAPAPPLWVWERAALPDDWLQEKLIKPMKIQ